MMGDALTRIRPGTPPFLISNGAGLAKDREIGFIRVYSFLHLRMIAIQPDIA